MKQAIDYYTLHVETVLYVHTTDGDKSITRRAYKSREGYYFIDADGERCYIDSMAVANAISHFMNEQKKLNIKNQREKA